MSVYNLLKESAETVLKSTDNSRFHNFEVAGRVMNQSPVQALLGMMIKHIVSVNDILRTASPISEKFFLEKFGNAYNYSLLLLGLITQENDVLTYNNLWHNYDPYENPAPLLKSFSTLYGELSEEFWKSNTKFKVDLVCDFVCVLLSWGETVEILMENGDGNIHE